MGLTSPAVYSQTESAKLKTQDLRFNGEEAAQELPSKSYSVFLVVVAAIEALLTSGIVFGWAPLQLMLEHEGIYGDACGKKGPPCKEQSDQLAVIYTVATSFFCFCVWPTGVVLDRFGPRVCCMMGALFFGVGTIVFGLSDNKHDYFMLGYIFMALGGLPVVLAMMHLSNLLPVYAGTIITIMNVMIDCSALDFKVFEELTNAGVASRKDIFLYYTAVPVAIFLTAPFLWPMDKYDQRQEDADVSEGEQAQQTPPLAGKSYAEQLFSKEFFFCVMFTAIQLLHVNFYLCTVDDQVRQLPFPGTNSTYMYDGLFAVNLDAYTAKKNPEMDKMILELCSAFAWILPLGGLAMTAPVGAMLDNSPMWLCVLCLSIASLIHSYFAMVPDSSAQWVGFIVFAYFRAALFGTMATQVAFTFGHENFGKLWGVLYLVSGLLNFCITPLTQLENSLGGFNEINVAFGVTAVVLLAYPAWLYSSAQKANVDAEDRKNAASWEKDNLL